VAETAGAVPAMVPGLFGGGLRAERDILYHNAAGSQEGSVRISDFGTNARTRRYAKAGGTAVLVCASNCSIKGAEFP
jgi:hypothetical protein